MSLDSSRPLTARRAGASLTVLFLALYGPELLTALGGLAHHLIGLPWDLAGWHEGWNVRALSTVIAATCVLSLGIRRSLSAPAKAALPCLLLGLGILPLATPWALAAGSLLLAVVGVVLCWALLDHAGLPLLPDRSPDGPRRRAEAFVASCAVATAGLSFTAAVIAGISHLVPLPPLAPPLQVTLSQPEFVVRVLSAGLYEELPMTLMVVVLLVAARRPSWQIFAVACAIRVLPHVTYFGVAAIGISIVAVINVWLYRRTGRVLPIVVAHMLYNASAAFASPVLVIGCVLFSFYGVFVLNRMWWSSSYLAPAPALP